MVGKDGIGIPEPIVRMADGTIKQVNMLTGTEVWTVPGRGHRPLGIPVADPQPLSYGDHTTNCAFCSQRYYETPPEKARLVKHRDGTWEQLQDLPADKLFDTTAEFRRIPNLFEIISYQYWNLNYGHTPSESVHRRMAEYLGSESGYDHILRVVRSKLKASGLDEDSVEQVSEDKLLTFAHSFFSGGHDLIVGRRHFVDGAETSMDLAGAGTLTPEEHRHYTSFTIEAMRDLYKLNPQVRYVATFQNWLKPAGASFDHLHKQLVAIDEHSVQTDAENERLHANPAIYQEIFDYATRKTLMLCANEHAVGFVGFGHRFPTVAVWPLGAPKQPWEYSREEVDGVSDILHALHAATGVDVPCNEEWYHRPPDVSSPMRWRILLKWRISTLAGFEGGTRIYLNTIDPWGVRDRMVPRLEELRDAGLIAPMDIGLECKIEKMPAFVQ
ncbi:MAG: DUF4921 family protein [Actinomycetaceae bacterium]|nr:DUF4921 family protein [Actinomycetaceae bacterium]